jgi:hypothetical protein
MENGIPMPTKDPPPNDRINYCLVCHAVIPERRDENGKRLAGKPREYCQPVSPTLKRSECELVHNAVRVLEEHAAVVMTKMDKGARTALRSTLFSAMNSVPQGGFNSPEWKAKHQKKRAGSGTVAAPGAENAAG